MVDISKATQNNWKKLKVDEKNKTLDKRANKTKSKKTIMPVELFLHKENITVVKEIVEFIKKEICLSNMQQIMYTLSLRYLILNKLLDNDLKTTYRNVNRFLLEYEGIKIIKKLLEVKLPLNEPDILGIIYQSLQEEGNKNKKGSYYTPSFIVKDMLTNINITKKQKVLDPCCGTGMFLLGIETDDPNNIYGYDIDVIAVQIAKVNLMVKYKRIDFDPKIERKNYFNDEINEKFDIIITNPPWGAKLTDVNPKAYEEIKTKESFSYALYKSINLVNEDGKVIFLLPESFLNVKTHTDIREYVIKNISIEKIVKYNNIFSGVVTKSISIVLKKSTTKNKKIQIFENNREYFEDLQDVLLDQNKVITTNLEIDKKIMKKIYSREYENLKNSKWAIGIVTGDNKKKLIQEEKEGFEKIYTGKEVVEYNLLPCKNYIKYVRSNLQQVAPDEIYREPEKLVYKFISNKLVFAYDNTKSLFLNSANILIPNFKHVTKKEALAFLNSTVFRYLYIRKFGEIKILRGNLEQLPFPILTNENSKKIEDLVDKKLEGKIETKEINKAIYKIYDFKDEEIKHIEGVVNGKVN